MKRTIIAFALTFIALCSYAGTDDSGLQVYTIKGEDMMGTTMAPNTEGLKFGQGMQNMFQTGNGLSTFYTGGSAYGSLSSTNTSKFLDLDSCYTPQFGNDSFYYSFYTGTSSVHINLSGSGFSSSKKFKYTDTLFGGLGLASGWSFVRAFKDPFNTNRNYIFTPKRIFSDIFLSGTSEITFPFGGDTLLDCEYHKNRVFCGALTGYVYYSSALDLADFTNASGKGGTIKLPSPIRNLESTQYGLYIFTSSGVYLLSGGEQPSSWKLEEVFPGVSNYVGLNNRSHDSVFERNNVVYFISQDSGRDNFCVVYSISGYSHQKIAYVPPTSYPYYAGLNMLGENTLMWYNGTDCSLLDINTGALSTRTDITSGTNAYNFYCYNTYGMTGYAYKIYWKQPLEYNYNAGDTYITSQPQFWYRTPIINFGTPGNQKEISRVEVDYIFAKNFYGAGSKCEMYLYYPYVNFLWTNVTSPAISENDTGVITPYYTKVPYKTFVWNAPAKVPMKRCYLDFHSYSTNYAYVGYQQSILKEIRIYYRDLGAYKK